MILRHFSSHLTSLFNQLIPRWFSFQPHPPMEGILRPPEQVYLMTCLDKNAFDKAINVPVLHLKDVKLSSVVPVLKSLLLKVENFKPIRHIHQSSVRIYLNPELVQKWSDISKNIVNTLNELEINESNLQLEEITLKYDNYTAETLLRSVLPKNKEGVSSFTKVGHIVHVNLREHLMPFKNVIGEILFDKVKGCESVVNKIDKIDNTYRNFQMEVLKGSSEMKTKLRENNCAFEFDFSTVYWNSRLCTEHERIVNILKPRDVLFDVFAGVGPFSVPAAKKKCIVFANDLNPESYKWLVHNRKLNKISEDHLRTFNLDGREFILKVIKEQLLKLTFTHEVIITMNLPAMAVEFLSAFVGLYDDVSVNIKPVTIYLYCFAKGENPCDIAKDLIRDNLRVRDVDSKIVDIFKVRTVSSMKEMMRVTLKLDRDILVGVTDSKRKLECDTCPLKKIRTIAPTCFR